MCGIVGTIKYRDSGIIKIMNDRQFHRGPDSGGSYWNTENAIGFAMRRLGIVDLENGKQPMTNEDGKVILVFNGEIFNANCLREELIRKGHIFKTASSDTEVLVHLYEEYGTQMLHYLNGMFAFAIYDMIKKCVFMARDQMGIKPFHYIYDGHKLAFASEMKSLIAAGLSEQKINMQSLWQYLSFQCVPAPMSIYEDIHVLPAAHYMVYNIETDELDVKKYWNCIENREVYTGRPEEVQEYVRENVIHAVERWTMSDVPLACSLSGGLDSSVIAAIIAQKQRLHTYTLGFCEPGQYDERYLARQMAEKYGTIHEEIILTPDDLLKDLDQMIEALDSPYAGGLPSWFIYKQIQGQEKVAFNGTGGDELFGNYSKWLRYEHLVERQRMYKLYKQYGEGCCEFIKYPNGSIYHKYFTENLKRQILNEEYWGSNTNGIIEEMLQQCPEKRWRDRIPFVDFKIQLPEEFLMMADRFSMNFSIEARVPFLDRVLVERILGIPSEYRTRKYEAKYLLKESMKEILPKGYLDAPKRGFVLPYKEWMYGKLRTQIKELCLGEFRKKQGIFGEELENKLIKPFLEGNEHFNALVWTVLMFQLWYQKNYVK